ncbi:MAG: LysE family transporter [Pseudomonadales bacterium]|jgi:threonine/homoserine/homoserine lactone efflux protein|nr:LysE family transporter [Pseudomonadales bacterium]
MTLSATAALFSALCVLAAVPSTSVFAVTARAASGGFRQGALTALGIVVGDLILVALAVFGLALIVETFGEQARLLRALAAGYLLLLGILTLHRLRAAARTAAVHSPLRAAGASFMVGLLITLGDQKAVLFYLAFLPAFVDLQALTPAAAAVVFAITAGSVGGVKLAWAWIASRAGSWRGRRAAPLFEALSGVVMVAAAIHLLVTR